MKKNKKTAKRLDGKNVCLALTKQLETDMRSFCRDKGIDSENELIRQAISKFIYADYEDETMKLQGIKQTHEKLSELKDMINILFSYTRFLHIYNLAYHPEIGPQNAEAAIASANFRHEKIFNKFQDSLKNEPPFFERLLHKFYSEDNGQN